MTSVREIELGELMPQEGRRSVNPADYPGEVFELLSIPAYDRGSAEIALGSEIGSTKQAVQPGDVLLSKIVPHIRRAGVVEPSAGSRQIASSEWIVFRSKEADARYLRHFLVSDGFHRQFMQTVSGVGGSLLRARPKYVAKIKIPLPPLEEQRRIAAILDKVHETLSLRRSCLQDLTASLELNLFLDLFGSPATNPKGWKLVQIGDLAEIFSDGPFGSNLKSSHYTESGVRVVRLQNIGVREFVDNDKAFVSSSHYEELSKHTCLPGDILIGTLGDPNLRACIQPNHIPIAINKADCVQMRCADSMAHPLFVMHLLNTPDANAMASSLILGQTRGRISMGRLRGLSIPVPPVELQAEFALRVEKTESLKQSLRLSFAEADQLKGALSHSFFQEA